MSTIVIKADKKSNKLLSELAKKLGGEVINLDDNQFEDIALGNLMDEQKTSRNSSRDEVMDLLGE